MRQIKRSIMKLLQIIMIWRRRNSWTDVRVSLVWYPFEPWRHVLIRTPTRLSCRFVLNGVWELNRPRPLNSLSETRLVASVDILIQFPVRGSYDIVMSNHDRLLPNTPGKSSRSLLCPRCSVLSSIYTFSELPTIWLEEHTNWKIVSLYYEWYNAYKTDWDSSPVPRLISACHSLYFFLPKVNWNRYCASNAAPLFPPH